MVKNSESSMSGQIFQPSNGKWSDYANKGVLASVLDPRDTVGKKNKYIDYIQKEALRLALRNDSSATALDFGCGTGRICRFLSTRLKKVIGIDITLEMLAVAGKECASPNVCYAQFDGTTLPIKDNTIGLIVSIGVLQYIVPEKDVAVKALDEFKRVLKPQGKILLIEQVSFSGEKSGSQRKACGKDDYLKALSRLFSVTKSVPIRIGGVANRIERIVLKKYSPDVLIPILARRRLKEVMNSSDADLAPYPYVDYLFLAESESGRKSNVED
jgi:ubiquinone/menaquinone biosynthesis C-methylase UbiE